MRDACLLFCKIHKDTALKASAEIANKTLASCNIDGYLAHLPDRHQKEEELLRFKDNAELYNACKDMYEVVERVRKELFDYARENGYKIHHSIE